MLLTDNETKLDMLNNRPIAKTVVQLIVDSDTTPISIGIHGDWGAGKSSILEMIEDEFDNHEDGGNGRIKCVRFNGWRYQGLDDSKSALMGAIITELEKDKTIVAQGKDIFSKLWKNINWISAAKGSSKLAFSVATGMAPIAVLGTAFDILKSNVSSGEKIDKTIESVGGYLKETKIFEDTSSNKEFSEFQKNFDELLQAANINKLVVLIDDLDRCLPSVAIEVLEAMRLFMFTNRTAFVIAADETMIRYAVKKHFPDATQEKNQEEKHTDYGFADKYLEKLIQVPFRIPRLGVLEARIYIILLLVGSKLGAGTGEYKNLIDNAIKRLKKPWELKDFSIAELQEILAAKFQSVNSEINIAMQIREILAANTSGNPRKIKRFINMLLLREQVAKARGFDDAIRLDCLAKMMIAEYYYGDFYKEMAQHLNNEGKCVEMKQYTQTQNIGSSVGNKEIELEENVNDDNSKTRTIKKGIISKEKTDQKKPAADESWFEKRVTIEWALMQPDLSDVDLRPYYFACKENEDYFFDKMVDDKIQELITVLMANSMAIAGKKDYISSITPAEAEKVFDILVDKIYEQKNWDTEPRGIEGVRVLTELHHGLRNKLLIFIKSIDVSTVGIWILKGWDKALPKDSEQGQKSHEYLASLRNKEGVNPKLRKAAKIIYKDN